MPTYVAPPASRVAIFLHSGEYDRLHQGLSIAAAAAAAGRAVDVFFFWWALERLAQGPLDTPNFPAGREEVADRLESRGVPTLTELLAHIRESGHATLYACSASLPLVGVDPAKAGSLVDQVVGWSRILQLTAGVTDRFYL